MFILCLGPYAVVLRVYFCLCESSGILLRCLRTICGAGDQNGHWVTSPLLSHNLLLPEKISSTISPRKKQQAAVGEMFTLS